jgi:hypothetical protein
MCTSCHSMVHRDPRPLCHHWPGLPEDNAPRPPTPSIQLERESLQAQSGQSCFAVCLLMAVCIPASVQAPSAVCLHQGSIDELAFEHGNMTRRPARATWGIMFCFASLQSVCILQSLEISGKSCHAGTKFDGLIFELAFHLARTGVPVSSAVRQKQFRFLHLSACFAQAASAMQR